MADEYLKGALGERRRIATILNAPEAAGRMALAQHLALETHMSTGEAQRALSAAPRSRRIAGAIGDGDGRKRDAGGGQER